MSTRYALRNGLFRNASRFARGLAAVVFVLSLSASPGFSAVQEQTSPDVKPESFPPARQITVIGSRLPSYRVPFADVPANTSYIPANVTKKTDDQINLTYPLTFQDAVEDVEGAVLYDAVGNELDRTFALRGFTDSSSTIVLVDGVRMNELDGNAVVWPLIRTSDVESIQIDRGSASHIYGTNAFGGVVHITTGRPSEKPLSLFGGFEISSHRGIRFNQGASGTLQDRLTPLGGKFTYYFNGERDTGHGFRENGEYRLTYFDVKTAYELPDEKGRVFFNAKHFDTAISNPGEMTVEQFRQNPEQTNKPLDGRKNDTTILSMGADKKFLDDKLTASIFNSWYINQLEFVNTTGTFTNFVTGADPDTSLAYTKSRATDLVWQLSYVDELTDWLDSQSLLGMEFRDGSEFAKQVDAFGGMPLVDPRVRSERSSEIYNTALFWRETLEFYEKVIWHVGMRHDFYWLDSDDALTPSDSVNERWRNSSLSTGLTVKPLSYLDLFANYSQGFRVPTASEIAPFSGTVSTNLQPEESDSYEVGTRVRVKDRAQFKASYFLIDVEDAILFDSTAIGPTAPFGQNINTGEVRRTGVETRLDVQPLPELDLYGSYTWTKAWNRTTNPAGTLPDDRDLGQVPTHRFTAGFLVQPFQRTHTPLLEGFRFAMNAVYTGEQHPSAYESTSQTILNATGGAGHIIKPYTVVNLMLSYLWKEKEIYFKITNLFDEDYYSRAISATSFGTSIYPAGTYTFVNPGAGREYYGGVRWRI